MYAIKEAYTIFKFDELNNMNIIYIYIILFYIISPILPLRRGPDCNAITCWVGVTAILCGLDANGVFPFLKS